MFILFWLVFLLFVLTSLALVGVVITQEPKQGGLGEGLGGGGQDFTASTGGTAGGLVEGMPLVLVHHVGAKSGTARIAPLVPFVEDGRVYVFASLGGADIHPAWYHNLLANPETVIELGDETVAVTARVLTGDSSGMVLRGTTREADDHRAS